MLSVRSTHHQAHSNLFVQQQEITPTTTASDAFLATSRTVSQTVITNDTSAEKRYEIGQQLIELLKNIETLNANEQTHTGLMLQHTLPHLRVEERNTMIELCQKTLAKEMISTHLEHILNTLLAEKNPSLMDLMTQSYTWVPPNTRNIQHPNNLIHTEQISTPEPTNLPFKAEYKKGHTIRLFENKAWRALKAQIKQEYVKTSWTQFLNGTRPEAAQEIITTNMRAALEQFQNKQKLRTKAEKYIQKKSQKSLYALNETGQGIFRTKRTTLSSRVYRAGDQRFYTLPKQVSKELKSLIKTEQGVKYQSSRPFLGEGSSGTVRLANLYENGAHHIVAAKETNTSNEQDIKELEQENTMRTTLKGNNHTSEWVSTNDYFSKHTLGRIKTKPILFMDLHAKGDLNTVTHKLSEISNQTLREKAARTVAKQLVNSISKLHQANIAHRDIKPGNFMLSKDGIIMPVDFGLSTNQATISNQAIGTFAYLAPEELEAKPNRNPKRADTYALGHVLFNIWDAARIGQHDPLRNISNSLIHPDPVERPELTTVLEELGNDRFTSHELLHVLHTGKQPA